MSIKYVCWGDGDVRVSRRWHVVLAAARKDGVRFHINSGHRTLRQQLKLFRQNMRWNGRRWVRRAGHPLTAYPTPLAPHIRTGNPAHALDVQPPGAAELAEWLRHHGAHPTFPVPGESWHLEVPLAELTRLWRSYR